MTRYLTLDEALELHRLVVAQSGGSQGLRDLGGLESALAQPRMTFGGQELYPTLADKAAALGFSLVCNHPFVDGNKRTAHVCYYVFLALNDVRLEASLKEMYVQMIALAEGSLDESAFADWLRPRMVAAHGHSVQERKARYAR